MFFPVSNSFLITSFVSIPHSDHVGPRISSCFGAPFFPCLHISHVQTHGGDLCSDGGLFGTQRLERFLVKNRDTYLHKHIGWKRMKKVESVPASGWLLHENIIILAHWQWCLHCFFQETGKLSAMFPSLIIKCSSCPETKQMSSNDLVFNLKLKHPICLSDLQPTHPASILCREVMIECVESTLALISSKSTFTASMAAVKSWWHSWQSWSCPHAASSKQCYGKARSLHVSLAGEDNSLDCGCFRLGILQNVLGPPNSQHCWAGDFGPRCLNPSLWKDIRASNDPRHSQALFQDFYPLKFDLQLVTLHSAWFCSLCGCVFPPLVRVLSFSSPMSYFTESSSWDKLSMPGAGQNTGGPTSWKLDVSWCIIRIVVFSKCW